MTASFRTCSSSCSKVPDTAASLLVPLPNRSSSTAFRGQPQRPSNSGTCCSQQISRASARQPGQSSLQASARKCGCLPDSRMSGCRTSSPCWWLRCACEMPSSAGKAWQQRVQQATITIVTTSSGYTPSEEATALQHSVQTVQRITPLPSGEQDRPARQASVPTHRGGAPAPHFPA